MSEPKDSVVVPVEPTEAMLDAAKPWLIAYHHMRSTDRRNAVAEVYKAMLSASRFLPQEKDAGRQVRELAARMLDESADHVAENSANLRKYAGMENEARCRELAGAYLRECAICIRMDQKLADLNATIERLDRSNAAIDRAIKETEERQ